MTSIGVYDPPSGEDQRIDLRRGADHENNCDILFEEMIVENASKVMKKYFIVMKPFW